MQSEGGEGAGQECQGHGAAVPPPPPLLPLIVAAPGLLPTGEPQDGASSTGRHSTAAAAAAAAAAVVSGTAPRARAGCGRKRKAPAASMGGDKATSKKAFPASAAAEPAEPAAVLFPQYRRHHRRDLGADHEAILTLIKAVAAPDPHSFVLLNTPTPTLPTSLYAFVLRLLGRACLGKRQLNEAGFWLSLSKTVNKLEVESPGYLRSLLGPLRWQRANRLSTFTVLVPRPRTDDDEEEDDEEGGTEAIQEVRVQGTFPVGVALAAPSRAKAALRAAVVKLTGGKAMEAQQAAAWAAYLSLWRSHAPVPLARLPFLRFARGVEVQKALRRAGAGMEDPERRRAVFRAEVAGMDAVRRRLLPATASLLRDGRLPVLLLTTPGSAEEEDEEVEKVEERGQGRGKGQRAKEDGGGGGACLSEQQQPRQPFKKVKKKDEGKRQASGKQERGVIKKKKGAGKGEQDVARIIIGIGRADARRKTRRVLEQPSPLKKRRTEGVASAAAATAPEG